MNNPKQIDSYEYDISKTPMENYMIITKLEHEYWPKSFDLSDNLKRNETNIRKYMLTDIVEKLSQLSYMYDINERIFKKYSSKDNYYSDWYPIKRERSAKVNKSLALLEELMHEEFLCASAKGESKP